MKSKKIPKKLLLIMLITFLLGAGMVSYALLFDFNLIGQRTNSINTCSFNLSFDDENPIRLLNTYPLDYEVTSTFEPYTFHIDNIDTNCNDIEYTISLVDACTTCTLTDGICTLEDNTTCDCNSSYKMDSQYISYELKKVGTDYSIVGDNILELNKSYILQKNERADFELKIWIGSNAEIDDVYVYNNGELVTNADGSPASKNYCTKLNIEVSLADDNDETPPSVSSVEVVSPTTGSYEEGEAYSIAVTFDEAFVGGYPSLEIQFGTTATRVLEATSVSGNTLTYTSTIQSGDIGSLAVKSLSGGSITDDSGNNAITYNSNGNEANITLPAQTGQTVTAINNDASTIAPSCTITKTNTYPKYSACWNTSSAIASDTASNDGVTLTVSSTDEDLASLPYSWDNGKTWSTTTSMSGKRASSNEIYTVQVKDTDGNIGSCSVSVNRYYRYSIFKRSYTCAAGYELAWNGSARTCVKNETFISGQGDCSPLETTSSVTVKRTINNNIIYCTYNMMPTSSRAIATASDLPSGQSQIRMFSNSSCTKSNATLPKATLNASYECTIDRILGCGYDWG